MEHHPVELRNDQRGRVLHVLWDDGLTQQLPHALLRARCKCTVCQSQRLLAEARDAAPAPGPVPVPVSVSATAPSPAQPVADIGLRELRQVGQYGVQLVFSDGHERGIYPWSYMRTLTADGMAV